MTFPNAASGVKKLFIAEILQLIGTILIAIAAVAGLGALGAAVDGSDSAAAGFGIGALIGGAGSAVVMVIAFILSLVGLFQASKDEPTFIKYAFFISIAAIVLAVIQSFLSSSNPDIADVIGSVVQIASLLIFLFTIIGVGVLAQKLGCNNIYALGNKLLWVIAIISIISLILNFLGGTAGDVLAIAGSILSIASYIIFLLYLSKASRMLQTM